MPRDDRLAEELHQALEDLRAGRPLEAAAQNVTPELRPLLASAARLVQAAASRHGPRPSFVLGLEEQLRTDVRLRVGRPRRWTLRRLLLPAAAALLLGVAGVSRWVPEGWPQVVAALRGSPEETRLDSSVERELDAAWSRLEELGGLLRAGRGADPALASAVQDIVSRCARARQLARQVGSERLAARADAEAAAVATELERLAGQAGARGYALRRGALAIRYDAAPPWLAAGGAEPAAGPRAVAPVASSTTVPTPTVAATDYLTPPVRTTTELPTATLALPPDYPTASVSPTRESDDGPPPVRPEPTATPTLPPPTPVPSPAVATPTTAVALTPSVATPTATRDDHREPTSTPLPTIAAATSRPTGVATVPSGETPAATPPDGPRP